MKSRMRCWRAVMSDTVLTLLVMGAKVAPGRGECKHMFEYALDTERTFDHHIDMHRTYVRRRRTAAIIGSALVAVLMSPLAAAAVRPGADAPPTPAAQTV